MHPGDSPALQRRNITGSGQRQLQHRPHHPEVSLAQVLQCHVACLLLIFSWVRTSGPGTRRPAAGRAKAERFGHPLNSPP